MLDKNLTLLLYLVVFAFSLTFVYFSNITKNVKKKKNYLILAMIPLWLLIILRSINVGADTRNYSIYYNQLATSNNIRQGYNWFWLPLRIFCYIVNFIFNENPFWFRFSLGSLSIYFLYLFLKETTNYSFFSLLLFIVFGFYLQTFNQSRQILALIIILYSTKYIKQNNFFKYFISVLFASIFHESSLIFIPFYFLKDLKINKKIMFVYIVGIMILFCSKPLLTTILSITKYGIYFTTKYNVSYVNSSIYNTLLRIALLLFCLFFKNKIEDSKLNTFSYHMIIFCTLIQILTLKYYFFGRLTTYFYAFYIILLPQCFSYLMRKLKKKYKYILLIISVLVLGSYFYVYYSSQSGAIGSGYMYYEFVFNE